MTPPRLLFISYSHEDQQWLERILRVFKAHPDRQWLDLVWCDLNLQPASEWRQEIQKAMDQASVGLLVVSQNFHDSDFIANVELPALEQAYQSGRLKLTWFRVDGVSFKMTTYARFQAVIPPEPPINKLDEAEQEKKLAELVENLIGVLRGRHGSALDESRLRMRARWKSRIATVGVFLILLLCWAGTRLSEQPSVDRTALLQLLHGHVWIGYEPADFNPDVVGIISEQSLRSELTKIRAAGFTGIVTYGSRSDLAVIPPLAKSQGLAVIMGIWNPLDDLEIRNAYSQSDFVDAYCVGHNGLNSRYSLEDLATKIAVLRRRTGRPVTTTQFSKTYSDSTARLNLMGDFLCPDVHHNLVVDVDKDAQTCVATIRRMSQLAQQFDRPLMLKSVTFPTRRDLHSGVDLQRQAEFFARVLDGVRDPVNGAPVEPVFILHGVFDSPWKNWGTFREWDPYTGLFEPSGKPRPAVGRWIGMDP